jgi:hypothetical protein
MCGSPPHPRRLLSAVTRPVVSTLPSLVAALVVCSMPVAGAAPDAVAPASSRPFPVHLSWGHQTISTQPFRIQVLAADAEITELKPYGFEPGDSVDGGGCATRAGAGDVDGLGFLLVFPERAVRETRKPHSIWSHLLDRSDPDTARRLRLDPGLRPDTRKLTVQMDPGGTRGFSLTLDQLLTHHTFWVPELDVFVAAGNAPVAFSEHQKELARWRGQRILSQLEREPEATYEQYTSRWEDMGSPAYRNPHAVAPGHIVGVTWDSAMPKFGIDRGGNVRNDYGNPDHFRFDFDFAELTPALERSWKGQKLADGLPVLTTTIERDGVRAELEQFAFPLHGPPSERRGDLPMVLLQKVRLTELMGSARTVSVGMTHRRELPSTNATLLLRTNGTALVWEETGAGRLLLVVQGAGLVLRSNAVRGTQWQTNQFVVDLTLPARGTGEFEVRLPSPLVAAFDRAVFLGLKYPAARAATLKFWADYLARGAQFRVPEEAVNTLFRANLWHALRLPRRHGATGANLQIDLPYSNFAYDQTGTPWPVNQAIYVDYMLYDLRGYHAISAEELAAMFRNNQEGNGHIGGFANWGVYTPSMIYAVAQHYRLSGDRASLDRLLPPTLKALDWCLAEMKRASEHNGPARGLVLAPLNDLSHDPKAWAFNQAYLYAGVEVLGRVLSALDHPRAVECRAAARAMQESVERGFARATTQAPLVQLRDHTWMPYVPGDALTPRRLLEIWYPTDVDCGALHLSRLQALDPNGPLTTYLLNDHEDNLFLYGWGMANEPVYNQHATALLRRDEVKPVIRAFYSMMACAFSHSVFEPVEHRWAWGQYFGPPSTDGAWFDLYRHMLIHERDDDTLLLLQATPRKWLEHGQQIRVERAPTYYGPLTLTVDSRAKHGEIVATVEMPSRTRPASLLVRLRHPQGRPLRSVAVNGKEWTDFDPAKEWVRIPNPGENTYTVAGRY